MPAASKRANASTTAASSRDVEGAGLDAGSPWRAMPRRPSVEPPRVDAVEHDAAPAAARPSRDGEAEAARRAGDERGAAASRSNSWVDMGSASLGRLQRAVGQARLRPGRHGVLARILGGLALRRCRRRGRACRWHRRSPCGIPAGRGTRRAAPRAGPCSSWITKFGGSVPDHSCTPKLRAARSMWMLAAWRQRRHVARAVPCRAHAELLGEDLQLAARRDAADLAQVHADVVDQPLGDQRAAIRTGC